MKELKSNLLTISFVCLSMLATSCVSNKKEIADRVITGNIYTAEDSNKKVEAIAIKDGKFIFAGSKKDAQKYIGKDTISESYSEEKLITPGLIDAHTHVTQLFIAKNDSLGSIDSSGDKDSFLKDIKKYVDENPTFEFYTLSGWEMLPFANETYKCPTASMLDSISTKPILCVSTDGHSYWVNSKVLEMAGITKNTVDPEGGYIYRDENGNPVGTLNDTAEYFVDKIKPEKSKDIYEKGITMADSFVLKQGYTYRYQAMGNAAYDNWKSPMITNMEELDDAGKLKCYTQSSFVINNTSDALDLVDEAIRLKELTKGGNFEMTTVKIFLDGIVENSGAYLSSPYNTDSSYYGSPRWKGSNAIIRMGQVIAKANKNGMSCHFHAMGDQAVSDALTAIEYAANEIGIDKVKEQRNTIVHLALVNKNDYARFTKYNVVACFNPWSSKDPTFYNLQVSLLGSDRAFNQYPMKSMVDAGIHYSFGTDLGASSTYQSIESFHTLTTRTYINDDPNTLLNGSERLSREEALKAMTIGGAYQLRREDNVGSIKVGKEASLCIFSKDLLEIKDTEIMSTELLNCMYKGNWSL